MSDMAMAEGSGVKGSLGESSVKTEVESSSCAIFTTPEVVKRSAYSSAFALSEVPVLGYFRYRDIFQILPPPPEAPLPSSTTGTYPFVIELSYQASTVGRKMPDIYAIDGHVPGGYVIDAPIVNIETAQEKRKHLLLLLTAFGNFRMFTPSNHQGWFISHGTAGTEVADKSPHWGQECYFVPGYQLSSEGFTEPKAPPVIQSDPSAYWGSALDQPRGFPSIISDLLDAAHMISDDAKLALLASCSLLDQGISLWQTHPSLSFASCVSSLEALIEFEHKAQKLEPCPKCEHKHFQVTKKFLEFFAKYGSPTPEFRKYAKKIYDYRSEILHCGKLFLGDVFLEKFASMDGADDRELHRSLIRVCRICIVNWVLAKPRTKELEAAFSERNPSQPVGVGTSDLNQAVPSSTPHA